MSVPVSSKCATSELAISLRISGSTGPTCLAHLDIMLMMVPVDMLTPNMLLIRSWMRLTLTAPKVLRSPASTVNESPYCMYPLIFSGKLPFIFCFCFCFVSSRGHDDTSMTWCLVIFTYRTTLSSYLHSPRLNTLRFCLHLSKSGHFLHFSGKCSTSSSGSC